MLDALVDVLSAVLWIVVFLMIASHIVMRNAVKGTYRRYIAKTSLILMTTVYIVLEFMRTLVLMYLADDIFGRIWGVFVGAVIITYFAKQVHDLLREDDDDWFNDRWKKLKRWIKNTRASLRYKPLPVH